MVCCAANAPLCSIDAGTDEEFTRGLSGKLLGQVVLLRRAAAHLRAGGSVTLTAGRFDGPLPGSSFGALVNAGLEAFVRVAAPELPDGIRVNAVSPGWVQEPGQLGNGMDGTPADVVARTYIAAVEDPTLTGETLLPDRS